MSGVTAEWFQDLVDFMHLLQPGRKMGSAVHSHVRGNDDIHMTHRRECA
jgi:hypothetical protein